MTQSPSIPDRAARIVALEEEFNNIQAEAKTHEWETFRLTYVAMAVLDGLALALQSAENQLRALHSAAREDLEYAKKQHRTE